MEKNKLIIVPAIIIVILLIGTFYKIQKNREEKLYNALYGKIEYVATQCYLNNECVDSITLQDLYDKDYLETQYDPITKEILDSKMKIEYKEDKVIIEK